jgi:hypothetical protein
MPIIGTYFGMRRPCGTILRFSKVLQDRRTGADVGVRQGDSTAVLHLRLKSQPEGAVEIRNGDYAIPSKLPKSQACPCRLWRAPAKRT